MPKNAAGKTRSLRIKDLSPWGKPIRLPFVRNVQSKGRLYHYFSQPSGLVRLPDESPEAFVDAYNRQMEERERPKTVPALIARYERSPDFRRLSGSTQDLYNHCFRKLCEQHPGAEALYHKRFAAHRLHGEWFEPHADILAEVERLNPPAPNPVRSVRRK